MAEYTHHIVAMALVSSPDTIFTSASRLPGIDGQLHQLHGQP